MSKYKVGDYVKLGSIVTRIKSIGFDKKKRPLYSLSFDFGAKEWREKGIEPYNGVWPETWIDNEDGQTLNLVTDDWEDNEGFYLWIEQDEDDDPPSYFIPIADKDKMIQTLKNMIAEIEKLK